MRPIEAISTKVRKSCSQAGRLLRFARNDEVMMQKEIWREK